MIVRIVKMTFMESKSDDFKEFVTTIRSKIRNFKGCQHLDILQDLHHRNIFFSYSRWETEQDLENYRRSDFFKETWSKASQWFKAKPRAWSTEKL
ncbi:MAG: antibiotic biosynthesis monooxygenase [Candidatus Aminicenantes bacterium]|nr:MAG: antibiotic biosynthesis monooxygenase [Candidatus Aminicenantes bacterium]